MACTERIEKECVKFTFSWRQLCQQVTHIVDNHWGRQQYIKPGMWMAPGTQCCKCLHYGIDTMTIGGVRHLLNLFQAREKVQATSKMGVVRLIGRGRIKYG